LAVVLVFVVVKMVILEFILVVMVLSDVRGLVTKMVTLAHCKPWVLLVLAVFRVMVVLKMMVRMKILLVWSVLVLVLEIMVP
jgi:hypothetical protein